MVDISPYTQLFGALSGGMGGGGMMPGMDPMGGFGGMGSGFGAPQQQMPNITLPQIFGAPVQHDNTWTQYPGMAAGGILGGIYGGPIGAMAGSKAGGSIGSGVGDAVGGNWTGVGQDFMASLQDGITQAIQGMNPQQMMQSMSPTSLATSIAGLFQ